MSHPSHATASPAFGLSGAALVVPGVYDPAMGYIVATEQMPKMVQAPFNRLSAKPRELERRPVGVRHATDEETADGTVCGIDVNSVFAMSDIEWDPDSKHACPECRAALADRDS